METKSQTISISLRKPEATDGPALHALVQACPPLDENSVYCNLLQCSHFANTSVIGELEGEVVCAISGYLVPGREDALFVWQVAVAEGARGKGVAGKMLQHILDRPECAGVRYLETTVTESNEGSWALFEGFARRAGAQLQRRPLFTQGEHFAGQHETEILARIGPLTAANDHDRETTNVKYATGTTA